MAGFASVYYVIERAKDVDGTETFSIYSVAHPNWSGSNPVVELVAQEGDEEAAVNLIKSFAPDAEIVKGWEA